MDPTDYNAGDEEYIERDADPGEGYATDAANQRVDDSLVSSRLTARRGNEHRRMQALLTRQEPTPDSPIISVGIEDLNLIGD